MPQPVPATTAVPAVREPLTWRADELTATCDVKVRAEARGLMVELEQGEWTEGALIVDVTGLRADFCELVGTADDGFCLEAASVDHLRLLAQLLLSAADRLASLTKVPVGQPSGIACAGQPSTLQVLR